MSSKLRTRNATVKYLERNSKSDNRDEDYKPKQTRRKEILKSLYAFSNARIASIQQQSDQLCSVVNENQIAASPSTLFCHREKESAKALTVRVS